MLRSRHRSFLTWVKPRRCARASLRRMQINIGVADKVVRAIIGVALLSMLFVLEGGARWLGLIGLVPLATAALGNCPLYTVLGITTCPAVKKA